MRADFIFEKSVKVKYKSLYEESYVDYFICTCLLKESLSVKELASILEENLHFKINYGKFSQYIHKKFIARNEKVLLNEEQKKVLKSTQQFKENLCVLELENTKNLYDEIGKYLSYGHFDFSKAIPFSLALDKIVNKKDDEYYASVFFTLVVNEHKNRIALDRAIEMLDPYYYELPLKTIFHHKVILQLLFANGLYLIKDLKNLSLEGLSVLFAPDFDNCVLCLSQLSEESKQNFKEDLKSLFLSSLSTKEMDIIAKRNGFFGKEMTLEEVGQCYGVTRERCRQIELKATSILAKNAKSIIFQILALYYSLTTPEERRYVSKEQVRAFMGDDILTKYLLFIVEISSMDVKYDKKLNILYHSKNVSLDELYQEIIDAHGPYLYKKDYESCNLFEKAVIDKEYREYYPGFYLLNGFSTKELIGMTIDEIYPNGYRIEEDYETLATTYQAKYHCEEMPSDRSVVGFLDRLDYCQIGKGTYKNRSLCIQIPQDLVDEIINYVLLHQPTVFYSSIFDEFKEKLEPLGITNYYYLKGVIDPSFPEDFKTKRNYVVVGELVTGYEAMQGFIRSFEGKFSLDDLRKKYKGVKDYTFYNLLYNEIKNGLIWLAKKNFIYIDKVTIPSDANTRLKEVIDSLFDQLHVDTTSARKVFARLFLTNKDLLNDLQIVTDSFSLFSLIKYWYSDVYGLSRPLISKQKDSNLNTYSLIVNYANSLDAFNFKVIKNYISKMNIRGLYSYLLFMEDMSDNFVQVSKDGMCKKEKFPMTDAQLREFKAMLDLIFHRFHRIDTREFHGYDMFPNLSYHWNPYLLVGIIRSYFGEEFEIENTETSYDLTEFIIKKQ